MRSEEIVEELKVDLERVRESIAFLETGEVRFSINHVDVTADWTEKQRAVAASLERLIEAYEVKDA